VVAKEDENGPYTKTKGIHCAQSGYEPSKELEKDIQDYAKKNIASYKYQHWIELLRNFPRLPLAKITALINYVVKICPIVRCVIAHQEATSIIVSSCRIKWTNS